MEVKLERINELRNETLWLYAALTVERTVSAVLSACMIRGQKIGDAKEILGSMITDREKRHRVFDVRESLIGATESDWDLMIDEYIPAWLKDQIVHLANMSYLEPEDNDEILERLIGRRRKMGFAPK
ncbi:MAG: hypothetical protein OXN19_16090 [Caldilineaceae bacterium]|nr:hypothetical protein [Caldilineaceae bacterium]